jgi:hypothetical protein
MCFWYIKFLLGIANIYLSLTYLRCKLGILYNSSNNIYKKSPRIPLVLTSG